MNKMKKRLLCLFSALVMLTGFVACRSGKGDKHESDSSETEEKAFVEVFGDIPKKDYDGLSYDILAQNNYALTFAHEMSSSEPVEDAVYRQVTVTENRYNVDVKVVNTADISKDIQILADSNDDVYEVVIGNNNTLANSAGEGYLLDLKLLSDIDFSAPWWNQTYADNLTINGHTYLAFGDFFYEAAVSNVHMFYFNKSMASEIGIRSPYDSVDDGTWTIETMLTMARKAGMDMNSDGVYDLENDRLGLSIAPIQTAVMFYTSDFHVLTFDESRTSATVDFFNERFSDFYDDLYNLNWKTEGVYSNANGEPNFQAFLNGNVLFTSWFFTDVARVRSVEGFDVGLLPYPKWEENADYINWPTAGNFLLAVPAVASAENYEFIGILTEALSAAGHHYLVNAVYDKTFKGKLARDEQSEKMIDLIFNTMSVDFGWIYGGQGSMAWFVNVGLEAKLPSIASVYKKLSERAQTYYDGIIDSYLKLDLQ